MFVEMFEAFVFAVPETTTMLAPVVTKLLALVEMFEVLSSIFCPVATGTEEPIRPDTVTMSAAFFAPVAAMLDVLLSIFCPVATGIDDPISCL